MLTMHPETYVLTFMGRLNWRLALETGSVTVLGRQDVVDNLPAWFGIT